MIQSAPQQLSNTLDSDFCVEALKEALHYGTPEIFNTDQGSQFTSEAFTGVLLKHGIKGRALDNIFVERLWRSVKYENVYLNSYGTIPEAEWGLGGYFEFYNHKRLHQSLHYRTPADVYIGSQTNSSDLRPIRVAGDSLKQGISGALQSLPEQGSLNLGQL